MEWKRADFKRWVHIPTRWMDDDVYGHVNNVVYYSYFDTAVNGSLIHETGIDIRKLEAIGVVVESGWVRPAWDWVPGDGWCRRCSPSAAGRPRCRS